MGASQSDPDNAHTLHVRFVPQYNGRPLVFDELSLTNAAGQTFSVTRLDFLVSDFALRSDDGEWIVQTNQAFLSLGEGRASYRAENIPSGNYDRLRFHIGLRPELNHSNPAQYPADHPLNANLNSLHWTWAEGYIFLALEGLWKTESGELNGYSFHLGNDPMLMTVELPVSIELDRDQSIELALHVNGVLGVLRLTENTSSTHSREDDLLAPRLKRKVESAFTVAAAILPPDGTGARERRDWNDSSLGPDGRMPAANPYRFTFSADFPMPDLPTDNPLTEEGVELGRLLFHEKRLSKDNTLSCASCHQAEAAFADGKKRFSIGVAGRQGERNSMPLFNLAWKKSFFWDGRAPTLREQVLEPIQNPIEMHETLENVVEKLRSTQIGNPAVDYPTLFERAFGTTEITADRLARALEQFLLTRLSYDSKFDRALRGEAELTEEQKRGFELFATEYDPRRGQFGADCFHCHGGPLFTTHGFANNGLDLEFSDLGRYLLTRKESDEGKFAVPSLRNVELTAPYMHDGRFATLEEVIDHYSGGVKRSATLDPNLAKHPDGGVPLSSADKDALVAFLKTLTDAEYSGSSTLSVGQSR